jgi:putative spermidine/putrescine transport system permease protein
MRTPKAPTQYGWAFIIPAGVLLGVIFIYPISLFILRGFFDPAPTSKHLAQLFDSPVYFKVCWTTIRISFSVTVICLLLGYPIAYLLSAISERTRNLLLILVVIPFWTSLLVRNYAWMVLLGRGGVFNTILVGLGIIETPIRLLHNMFAVHVGMTHMMIPFMVLALFSVMKGIDRRLLTTAESLGANRFQTFSRIFVPLSLPGVGSGSLLVFIYSLGFFVTPALLGGREGIMISMLIEQQVVYLLNWGFASLLSFLLLLTTILLFFLYSRFFKLERIW